MGCGSSKKGSSYDEALPAHLARVLEMPTDQLVLKQYVASLRAEGWDSPNAFDDLTMDELKNKPFCFKAGHLRMVARSRKKSVGTGNAANDVDQPSLNRGRSSQQSQNGAEQIAAEAAPAADRGTSSAVSVVSGSTKARPTAANQPKMLPVGAKTKPLLPDGKHAFLSYQWDVQEQVKEIKGMLNEKQIKCTDAIINRGLSPPSPRMPLMVCAVLQIKRGANCHTSVLSWHRTLVLYTLC